MEEMEVRSEERRMERRGEGKRRMEGGERGEDNESVFMPPFFSTDYLSYRVMNKIFITNWLLKY